MIALNFIRKAFFILLVLMGIACTPSAIKNGTDLSSYHIPYTIRSPEKAEIRIDTIGEILDVTVEKGRYRLQIFSMDAYSKSLQTLLKEELDLVQGRTEFVKLLQEDKKGFLYETKWADSTSYDFRYFELKDNRQYVFSTGKGAYFFKKNEVETIYKSVQN